MNLLQIKNVFDDIIGDIPLIYRLDVTTPTTPIKKRQLPTSNLFENKPFRVDDVKFSEDCKSIIVWSVFSKVTADYYFKNDILPKVINELCKKYGGFGYDNYVLNRKQFAIRSGAGKLSKPSLIFSPSFGLNFKIELITSSHEFEDVVVVEDDIYYDGCIGCDAPCEYKCPMKCKMNYELSNWEDCSNFIDTPYMFDHPDEMCKICQSSCPPSNYILNKIDSKYGNFLDPKYLYLNKN